MFWRSFPLKHHLLFLFSVRRDHTFRSILKLDSLRNLSWFWGCVLINRRELLYSFFISTHTFFFRFHCKCTNQLWFSLTYMLVILWGLLLERAFIVRKHLSWNPIVFINVFNVARMLMREGGFLLRGGLRKSVFIVKMLLWGVLYFLLKRLNHRRH
jgi:hypothetical protein